jgi:hypothetical protein
MTPEEDVRVAVVIVIEPGSPPRARVSPELRVGLHAPKLVSGSLTGGTRQHAGAEDGRDDHCDHEPRAEQTRRPSRHPMPPSSDVVIARPPYGNARTRSPFHTTDRVTTRKSVSSR